MKPYKVYACYNMNQEIRLNSSSGAVFSALADYIFSLKGIVYGVAMSEDCYSAEFIRVTDRNGLTKLRGSKYLQAKVGDTYKKVRNDVVSGKLVLFTGTGCQVNGLKNFLGKNFDNLICVDVICHGVPSPVLWRKYVQYQEEKNAGKLRYINFRCKDNFQNEMSKGDKKKLCISKDIDPYMQMFLRDYSLRPSCYNCTAKTTKKSDLTMADFWGIDMIAPEMNDRKGVSLVLIRTERGLGVFKQISMNMKLYEVDYEAGVACNPSEYKSCVRPPQRDDFFEDMLSMHFEELEKRYLAIAKRPILSRIKGKIKYLYKKHIQNTAGGNSKVIRDTDYSICFVFDCKK